MQQNIPIKFEDYYLVQYPPTCIEWEYLMTKLLSMVKIEAWNDWFQYKDEETGNTVYRLKKERFPAQLVATTFGLSAERVIKLETLVLDPPAANKDLPKPTVGYWGTA